MWIAEACFLLSRLAFRSFFAWLSWLISSTAAKGVARRDTYQHSYEGGFARRARAVPFAQGSFLIFCHRIIFLRALRRTPPLACVFRKRRWRRFFWGYFVVLSLRQNLRSSGISRHWVQNFRKNREILTKFHQIRNGGYKVKRC